MTDSWDEGRCEAGMEVAGTRVTKVGGGDLTSVFGTLLLTEGSHCWGVQLDEHSTHNENVMIGVAKPDVPLDVVQQVWWRKVEPSVLVGSSWWFIKSGGNTTSRWPHHPALELDMKPGDMFDVEVDLDAGTVDFMKEGECLSHQEGVTGPVSIWINFDYDGNCVSLYEPAGLLSKAAK
mmetsp:Transcript_39438/g.92682  ORF Transcript_39438/g.92682 Transcript_39438/m.92682 type:complete len:178 (-) Transcript_39438:39-572(-)